MVVANFSEEETKLKLSRFKEILSVYEKWKDVVDDREVSLNPMTSITIKANGIMILETK